MGGQPGGPIASERLWAVVKQWVGGQAPKRGAQGALMKNACEQFKV
jgi:hypothetical protein